MEEQRVLEVAEEFCERYSHHNTCYLEEYGGYCDPVIAEAKRLLSKTVNLLDRRNILGLRNRNA